MKTPLHQTQSQQRGLARAYLLALVLFGLSGLMACSTPKVQDYALEGPTLDLRQYFKGPLTAHGIFTDRSGKVVRRFVVDMTGTWSGAAGQEVGVLDEKFRYLDAESLKTQTESSKNGTSNAASTQAERRVWTLRHLGNGRYSGTADDVRGEAKGEVAGNAFYWNYTLKLPYEGRVIDVEFDDWMYLVDERVMLNKAVMSKWGIRLGEVTLVFTKP